MLIRPNEDELITGSTTIVSSSSLHSPSANIHHSSQLSAFLPLSSINPRDLVLTVVPWQHSHLCLLAELHEIFSRPWLIMGTFLLIHVIYVFPGVQQMSIISVYESLSVSICNLTKR